MKSVLGYLMAAASAVIYGLMPLMATHVYADGVNSLTLVAMRNLFALPVLAALALIKNKTLKIPSKALPSVFLIGVVGMAATPILLLSSYNYIDSSAATVLHFIYPALVVVGGMVILREKVTVKGIVSLLLCGVGVLLFYDPRYTLDPLGSAIALLSGVVCAAYAMLVNCFKYKEIPIFTFSFYVSAIGGTLTLLVCLFTNSLALPQSAIGWGLSIFFALIVTVGAVVLYQKSIFIIGSSKASVLSALEPATSVIVGIFIMQENSSVTAIIGSILVISAGLVIALGDLF